MTVSRAVVHSLSSACDGALVLGALLLGACVQAQDDPPPVFVTQTPLCLVLCFTQLGSVREDVDAIGAAATGGAQSLGQSQSASVAGSVAQ